MFHLLARLAHRRTRLDPTRPFGAIADLPWGVAMAVRPPFAEVGPIWHKAQYGKNSTPTKMNGVATIIRPTV